MPETAPGRVPLKREPSVPPPMFAACRAAKLEPAARALAAPLRLPPTTLPLRKLEEPLGERIAPEAPSEPAPPAEPT